MLFIKVLSCNGTKHCSHSPRKKDCVCKEPLGFYICTVGNAVYGEERVPLAGEHGLCELYKERKVLRKSRYDLVKRK